MYRIYLRPRGDPGLSVVGAWRRGRRSGAPRCGWLVLEASLVAVQDRAVLAVARLHPAAKCGQVLISIHDRALGRLCGPGVVFASVQRDPPPPIFITPTNLWPGQSTTHAMLFLGSLVRRPAPFAGCGDPSLAHRITGPRAPVKKGDAALQQESARMFS